MTIEKPMTPNEFMNRALKIRNKWCPSEISESSPEESHVYFDDLMAEVLRELGYGEGMDIIENTVRWYS